MSAVPLLIRGSLEALLREKDAQACRLTPTCHPRAGVDLVYTGAGLLRVGCHRCHADVATIVVGQTPGAHA